MEHPSIHGHILEKPLYFKDQNFSAHFSDNRNIYHIC